MKTNLWIPILTSLVLGGCAGTSTEFQCNATTSDRCMTMEQANDIARSKTEGATGKRDAGKLPALVELPQPSVSPLAPLPALVTPSPTTLSVPVAAVSNEQTTKHRALFVPAQPGALPLRTEAVCSTPRCDSLGEATPLRLTDSIATIWIAPWIDASDVFHQPGRVSFVDTPGTWQLPQLIK